MKTISEEESVSTVSCTFNPPADHKKNEAFEKKHGLTLPVDYKAFLVLHEGAAFWNWPIFTAENFYNKDNSERV
ncbi:SMI1/KNR4 family protein [Fictibacillus sp. KIGAM418]|uniref:SMI1/KNR4 family protein n=1 Tax=Fictibacillus marinisediminis TaxID=2878389 RepID=A0A9X2BBX1_9BACL|nr:SMI1/KNR4 family protein [Fictibacillus marinisediminis]MCK6256314.1 SMI1/KNR4 family protein [Fictibacillus marinisediminis]